VFYKAIFANHSISVTLMDRRVADQPVTDRNGIMVLIKLYHNISQCYTCLVCFGLIAIKIAAAMIPNALFFELVNLCLVHCLAS